MANVCLPCVLSVDCGVVLCVLLRLFVILCQLFRTTDPPIHPSTLFKFSQDVHQDNRNRKLRFRLLFLIFIFQFCLRAKYWVRHSRGWIETFCSNTRNHIFTVSDLQLVLNPKKSRLNNNSLTKSTNCSTFSQKEAAMLFLFSS